MRCAFVIRLQQGTEAARRRFVGCIEEVDSGVELKFHSTEELLEFLAYRFLEADRGTRQTPSKPSRKATRR